MNRNFYSGCEYLANVLNERGYTVSNQLLKPSASKLFSEIGQSFKHTQFYSLALEHCLDHGELWAYNLRQPICEPKWYLIELSLKENLRSHEEERHLVGKSKAESLAFVIEHLDYRCITPNRVLCDEDCIEFYFNSDLLAEIRPMQVTDMDLGIEQRVTRQLETLFWRDCSALIKKKLKKIYGLEELNRNNDESPIRDSFHPFLCTAKSLVNQMVAFLPKVTKSKIPRAEILELTATFFGFKSWNHFVGAEKTHSWQLLEPYMVYRVIEGNVVERECCLGEAAAFTIFAKKLRNSPNKAFDIGRFTGPYATTDLTEEGTGSQYFYMSKIEIISSSDYPIEKAKNLLETFDLESSVLNHFGNSLPQIAKLQKRAMRRSSNSNHLLLGNWLVFSEPGLSDYDEFVMERYNSNLDGRIERISGSQYKCSFTFNEKTKNYWLSKDWGGEPDYPLEELNVNELQQIERQFFAHENWNPNLYEKEAV